MDTTFVWDQHFVTDLESVDEQHHALVDLFNELSRGLFSKRSDREVVLADTFRLPSLRHIDARLLGGAALFGMGWGIAGYCPGPALANLAQAGDAIAFVIAMLAGSQFARLLPRSP